MELDQVMFRLNNFKIYLELYKSSQGGTLFPQTELETGFFFPNR